MEEAAELLGINMEDLQIDGNLHRDAENEVYDEDLLYRLQNKEEGNEEQIVLENDFESPTRFENIDEHFFTPDKGNLIK